MRRLLNWLGSGIQVKPAAGSRRPRRVRLEIEGLEVREVPCSYPPAPLYHPPQPVHTVPPKVVHTTAPKVVHTTVTDQLTHMGTLDIGHDPRISQLTSMGTLDIGHTTTPDQLTHMGTLDLGHDPKINQLTQMGTLDIGHKVTGLPTCGKTQTTKPQAPKGPKPHGRTAPIYLAPVETNHAATDAPTADGAHGAGVMMDDAPAPAGPPDPRSVARTNDFEVRVVHGIEGEFGLGGKIVTYAIREKLSDGSGETVHITQVGIGAGFGAGFGVSGSSSWQEFQTKNPMSLNEFKGHFGSFVDGPSISLYPIVDTGEAGDTRTALHIGGKDGVTIPVDVESNKSIGANLVSGGFSYFF